MGDPVNRLDATGLYSQWIWTADANGVATGGSLVEFPDPVGETAAETFERFEASSQRGDAATAPAPIPISTVFTATGIATPDKVVFSTPIINSIENVEPCGHATSASTKEIWEANEDRQTAVNARKQAQREEQYNTCTESAGRAYETASSDYQAAHPKPVFVAGDAWGYGVSTGFAAINLTVSYYINQMPRGSLAWGGVAVATAAGGYLSNLPGYLKEMWNWNSNFSIALQPALDKQMRCEDKFGPRITPYTGP